MVRNVYTNQAGQKASVGSIYFSFSK